MRFLFILLGFIYPLFLFSSDVVVTSYADTGNGNGRIDIRVDQNVVDFPLELSVFYPNGIVLEESISSDFYGIDNLYSGLYEIQITSFSGCLSIVDIYVDKCMQFGNRYLCFANEDPETPPFPEENVFFLTVDEQDFIDSYIYKIHGEDKEYLSMNILNEMIAKGDEYLLKAINFGWTEFDISSQSEVMDSSEFIMKLDEDAEVKWIEHDFKSKFLNKKNRINSIVNSETQRGFIFPNPATDLFFYKCQSQYINSDELAFILIDQFGKISKKVNVQAAENGLYKIHNLRGLPSGLYYCNIFSQEGLIDSKKIILNNE